MSTYKSPFVSVEEVLALKNGSGSGREECCVTFLKSAQHSHKQSVLSKLVA